MNSLRVQMEKALKEPLRAPGSPRIGPEIPSYTGLGLYRCGFSILIQRDFGVIHRLFITP